MSLQARASFNDTRPSERDSFLAREEGQEDTLGKEEVMNPFSKRSAASSICNEGVLHRHKRPFGFNIGKGTARRKNKEEGLTAIEFLEKIEKVEKKAQPRDYTLGCLPREYGGITCRDDLEENRVDNLPSQKTSKPFPDQSFAGTGAFLKKWRSDNNVRLVGSRPLTCEGRLRRKKNSS